MTRKEEVVMALGKLGGVATLNKIYDEVVNITQKPITSGFKASIRATIELHSSDSEKYNGTQDIFYSVYGKGKGVWRLRNTNYKGNFVIDEIVNLCKKDISHRIISLENKLVNMVENLKSKEDFDPIMKLKEEINELKKYKISYEDIKIKIEDLWKDYNK